MITIGLLTLVACDSELSVNHLRFNQKVHYNPSKFVIETKNYKLEITGMCFQIQNRTELCILCKTQKGKEDIRLKINDIVGYEYETKRLEDLEYEYSRNIQYKTKN